MSLDEKTWKEYLKAKKVIDNIEDKDKLEHRVSQYERHKAKVMKKYHEDVQKGGQAFLDKIASRRKELYHLRKEKLARQKEEARELELARADRSKANGNPFGMAIHNLKIESSDSGEDTETDCGTDIYCSTCPTTDAESVASVHVHLKPSSPINIPPPPKHVQNLFRRPIWT